MFFEVKYVQHLQFVRLKKIQNIISLRISIAVIVRPVHIFVQLCVGTSV